MRVLTASAFSKVLLARGAARFDSFASFLAVALWVGCSTSGVDSSHRDAEEAVQPGSAGEDAGAKPAASTPAASPLPAATKGYELYAWDADGALHFVLITGTNREKTLAEISASDASIDSGDFVIIRGVGIDRLQQELARVPTATPVIPGQLAGLPMLGAESRAAVQGALKAHGG